MVTTTNLVSYYKLDENEANTTITDAHGSNNGTLNVNTNTRSTTGKINTAIDFTTANTLVSITSFDTSLASSDFSVNCWVNIQSVTSTSSRVIMSQGNVGSANKVAYCSINNQGYLRLGLFADDVTGNVLVTTGWHMLTFTHDTSTKQSKLYIDGTDAGSGTHSNVFSGNSNTYIGGFWNSSLDLLSPLDELAIFKDEILSTTSISELYNSGSGLAYPFVSDVDYNASPITLSLSNAVPSYFIGQIQAPISLSLSLPSPILPDPPSPYVTLGTGTKGTRFINTKYPIESGLNAGTEKQKGREIALVPKVRNTYSKYRRGLDI